MVALYPRGPTMAFCAFALPSLPSFSLSPTSFTTSSYSCCPVSKRIASIPPSHAWKPLPSCRASATSPYTVVSVVPTGISASIGGYAGDALPSARLLSSVADVLITHPNVLNGALLYYPLPNALYVEGHALDAFAASRLSLQPLSFPTNRIGLILDSSLPPDLITRHLQAADAARATLGLQIPSYTLTDAPLGVHLSASAGPTAATWGTLADPGSLLRAADRLLATGEIDALAIVASFPEEDEDALSAYRAGSGVDAVAGAEAVISHLVTREFGVPCAHAPGLEPLDVDDGVSPKAAAEELGYTFLSCVLVGLSRAPRLAEAGQGVMAEDVNAVVLPKDAFGGGAVMSLAERKDVLVVGVEENTTGLGVGPEEVGMRRDRVVWARSYAEAAGFIAAHKNGISLQSLGKSVERIALV